MKKTKGVVAVLTCLAVVVVLAAGALGFSIGHKFGLDDGAVQPVGGSISSANSSDSSGGAPGFDKDTTISPNSSGSSSRLDMKEEDYVDLTTPIDIDANFKVVGYYPSWGGNDTSVAQFDVLTHIIYAFAIPIAEGTLRPLENPERAQAIIKDAHKNDVKVLLAVGGWSYNDNPLEPTFKSATETPEKTKVLIAEIMKMVDEFGFDGVDMDWEHPRLDDSSKEQYYNLMKGLRAEINKRDMLLTAAVLSGPTPDGNILYDAAAHTDEVIALVDWLNIMAYDGGDGERHSSYDFAVMSGKYWNQTRGVAKEKCVLGVPFYGRPSWAPYEYLLQANPDAYKTDISMINGMEAHYNGVDTIKKKTRWAAKNLGGVMIWEIAQDTTDKEKSLQNAIGEALK